MNVTAGRLGVGKGFIDTGWNLVSCKKVLGERLGAFELRSGRTGAKAAQSLGFKAVNNTVYKRCFGTDDSELAVIGLGEVDKASEVGGAQVDVLAPRLVRSARVTGGDKDRTHVLGLRQFPGQGVFATSATYHQYIHISA